MAKESKAVETASQVLQGEIVLSGAELTQDIIDAHPERYKVLPNGAVYDKSIGRIVANPGGGKSAITQATSSEMRARRMELAREAVARGMIDGAASLKDISPSNVTEYDAVSLMAANLTNIAATKQDRAAIEAFRAVNQAAGLVQERGQQGSSDAPALQINVSGDALARLLQLMQGIDSD